MALGGVKNRGLGCDLSESQLPLWFKTEEAIRKGIRKTREHILGVTKDGNPPEKSPRSDLKACHLGMPLLHTASSELGDIDKVNRAAERRVVAMACVVSASEGDVSEMNLKLFVMVFNGGGGGALIRMKDSTLDDKEMTRYIRNMRQEVGFTLSIIGICTVYSSCAAKIALSTELIVPLDNVVHTLDDIDPWVEGEDGDSTLVVDLAKTDGAMSVIISQIYRTL
ncbi:hypothetical protein OF83DRAFT_1085750 [Amylostereum chailletii]|nr:hypothetical protein OF83DRAFT_1085750 [Amylostereum chailletii]